MEPTFAPASELAAMPSSGRSLEVGNCESTMELSRSGEI